MLGRLHHVVIDCPDPAALADFYSELLGLPVTYRSDDFVVVAASDRSSGLGFQLAPDHRPQSSAPELAAVKSGRFEIREEQATEAAI